VKIKRLKHVTTDMWIMAKKMKKILKKIPENENGTQKENREKDTKL
jgi:hypothetical protein